MTTSAEASLAHTLEAVFRASLDDLDPSQLVAKAIGDPPEPPSRVKLVAAGKAASAMARGALERWGDRVSATLIVTTSGAPFETSGLALRAPPVVLFAAHPYPDESSERAAVAALDHVRGLGPSDLVLALVSGGASSLLSLPPRGLDLATKRRVVQVLLEAGAPIAEVNLVRRHLSRIKGGRLALAARPAKVRTLVLGDVVDGSIADIGSGPTVPDPTTSAEAREVLVKRAPQLVAEGIDRHLDDAPGPSVFPVRTEASMLAGPADLSHRLYERLVALGFQVVELPPEGGDVHEVVARRVAQAASLAPGHALVVPCEPTVVLPERRGRGGRAGFVALAAMRSLPPGVVLLCGASDGVDGSSSAAGAIVSAAAASGVDASAIDHALATFDDATAHHALGTALVTGPTGQNLTDVHVLARAAPGFHPGPVC